MCKDLWPGGAGSAQTAGSWHPGAVVTAESEPFPHLQWGRNGSFPCGTELLLLAGNNVYKVLEDLHASVGEDFSLRSGPADGYSRTINQFNVSN